MVGNHNKLNSDFQDHFSEGLAIQAANIFHYLNELKCLQSPQISDITQYDSILWFSDIPKDKGCYCKAWELIRDDAIGERDYWIEIYKPKLQSFPEPPDGLDPFITSEQLENSAIDEPQLLDLSNEMLIRHFFAEDDDFEPETEKLQIDEHEDVFEKYIAYVDDLWSKWAERRRSDVEFKEEPPPPPEDLVPWLKMDVLDDFQAKEPILNEQITVEYDQRVEKLREELIQKWTDYISNSWKPWAAKDRELQKIQEIYNKLYTIYQRQQRLGEQFEVIIAFGFLCWNAPKSKALKRHVFTIQCTLNFDASRGIIAVGPTAEGNTPTLEYDMLDTSERPQEQEMRFLQDQVQELGEEFWDQAKLRSILEGFVNALGSEGDKGYESKGRYEHVLNPNFDLFTNPVISLAPAVILRKRSQRGFIQLLENIETYINGGGKIPLGILEIISGGEVISNTSSHNNGFSEEEYHRKTTLEYSDSEIYFPLPANKEQKEIIHRLSKGRGVLVQGPPGTGKSHTIVNMICHLLALGKRILVTSETNRALKALKARFIDGAYPLAELCVILLGNDEEAFQELEKAVSAISNKKNYWDQHESERHITELREKLDRIRRNLRQIGIRLREIREQDTFIHDNKFGYYCGSLQDIAAKISSEQSKYIWLKDIPEDILDFSVFPFTPREFVQKWREYRNSYTEHTDLHRIPIEEVPPVNKVNIKLNRCIELEQKLEHLQSKTSFENVEIIRSLDKEIFSYLLVHVSKLIDGLVNLEQHVYGWALSAGREIAAEQDRAWRELFKLSKEHIDGIKDIVREASSAQIEGVNELQTKVILSHATKLLEYLRVHKKIILKILLPKQIRESLSSLKNVTVDGVKPENVESLARLVKWLTVKDALIELQSLWAGRSQAPTGSFSITLAHYEDLLEPLELALSLHPIVRSLQECVDDIPKLKPPKWYIIDDLKIFYQALDIVQYEEELIGLKRYLNDCIDKITQISNIDNNCQQNLIESIRSKKSNDYKLAYQELCEINDITREYIGLLTCVQPLRDSLPITFTDFDENLNDDIWIERFEQLKPATQWILTNKWLEELCNPDTIQKLTIDYDRLKQDELRLIGELATELTWSHCIKRLTEKERQALVAWLQAIKKIGKGYGRHAERHRRIAKEKMNQCRSAIPAWVMPLHRVVESVSAQPEIFDIAIIDEASQSGPEALILNFLAKKVIVVGDDKQIKPRYVGINHDDVEYLRKMHLKNIPHSESFDLNSSYFSLAELKFPDYIRLREHFRCMPEIIQFSNNNFYTSEPLIPLRQYGSERLEPVVDVCHVVDGYRQGKYGSTINIPEAKAIVDKITECCADPDYDGKSMGIITLLGNKQATLIEELLVKEIDASEIELRNINVGVPYTFQGDERDVIFLSMVDAPEDGKRCRAMTRQEDQRQFNVAASRARDQMWLFHSATFNDLRQDCLRYKLLSHCCEPHIDQPEIDGHSLNELRKLAHYSDRTKGNQPPPFDSWFEVDVFLDIASKGFRVIPQYSVNPFDRSYRIDMVVEGMDGRLAVECYGDKWHGAAEYDNDMSRQRELERCGWHFWIVRGGAYYRDKEVAMASLWSELEYLQIFPKGISRKVSITSPLTLPVDSEEEKVPLFQQKSLFVIDKEAIETNKSDKVIQENASDKKQTTNLTAKIIQEVILSLLKKRPNNSIALKTLTKEVCKELSIRIRGNPRVELDKRIKRSVGVLKQKKQLEEYRAKNVRIRLI